MNYRHLFDISGKVAVVTGGGGILGQHFSEGLAAYGAKVAILDNDFAAAQEAADAISGRVSGEIIAVSCDVTQPESVRDAADRVERELGAIDVLHNNAATKSNDLSAFFAPIANYDQQTWREVMSVNLDGMFIVAQEIGSRMVGRRSGSIVQTSSIYGVMGPDQRIYEGSQYLGHTINTPAVYSASKAGVIGLTKYLATLWAPDNVRVNTLVPGGVESGQNESFSRRYSARIPLGRMARADEMVGTLIYLASDASSYVTGQTLMVDGGLSAW